MRAKWWLCALAVWLSTAVAVGGVGSAVWAIVSARGDRFWPVADGRVLGARFSGTFSPVPPGGKSGARSAPIRRWHLAYEYTVGDRTYHGEGDTAQAVDGPNVRVYYDSDDPSISVLEPGVDVFVLFYSVLFAAFGAIARQFAVWGRRRFAA
jgi:hypothetical protein